MYFLLATWHKALWWGEVLVYCIPVLVHICIWMKCGRQTRRASRLSNGSGTRKLTCRDCASYSWNRKLHMLVWPSVEQADAVRWQVDVVSALPYRSCQLGHFDFACSILITFPSEPPPLKHFLVVPLSLCCCFFSHPVLLLLAFVAWVVREHKCQSGKTNRMPNAFICWSLDSTEVYSCVGQDSKSSETMWRWQIHGTCTAV